MGSPNIPNGLQIAAAFQTDAATPPSLDSAVNVSGLVRDNTGIFTATFLDPIEVADRWVGITTSGFPNVFPSSQDPNGLTDTTCRIRIQTTAGAAVDVPFQFLCVRIGLFL